MDDFEFNDQKSGSQSPRSPRSPLRSPRSPHSPHTPRAPLVSDEIGWSPARYDPFESPSESPLPSPTSAAQVIHRPVATHLALVEHPDLTHDAMEASVHEYEEFELRGSESPYASEPGGVVEPVADGFNYVQVPPHLSHSAAPAQGGHGGPGQHAGIYYPAPVPAQLKLPPLLSRSNRHRQSLPARKPRPRSIMMMNVPLEPEWEPSPIDHELVGREEEALSDADSMMVESDHSSYAASVLSSSYQDGLDGDQPRASSGSAVPQNRGWLSRMMHGVIGKQGDPDNKDTELVQEQADIIDRFDTNGFSRFDPELIREEAKRFEVGGVYSGSRPASGRPTTLIEEIEIRKAGRLAQQRNMKMDADYIKSNLQAQNKFAHPLDKEHQPTLMDLQRIADTDYNDRKQWHHLATTKQRIERGEETLADRRARRRAQQQPAPEAERPLETLAERRARRRAEKEYREGLIRAAPVVRGESESLVESLSG